MTEIFINNVKVDTYKDMEISLNYAIADITQPERRNTSFSKTIKLPGSKVNNELFGHIFDISKDVQSSNSLVNFTTDFNPNLKASCSIFEDNVLQFSGIIQLLQVNRKGENYEYETTVFGSLKNIILGVGSKKLEDLDMSEFDHPFDWATMSASQTFQIYAFGSFVSLGVPGNGYVYPIIDYGYTQSPTVLKTDKIFPAIYAREYLRKIFAYDGFKYTSAFIDSDFFRRLIIPFNKANAILTAAERQRRSFLANFQTDFVYTFATTSINNSIIFPNDTVSPGFDSTGQYNGTVLSTSFGDLNILQSTPGFDNGVFKVKKDGYYDLSISIDFRFDTFTDVSMVTPLVAFKRTNISIMKGNTSSSCNSL